MKAHIAIVLAVVMLLGTTEPATAVDAISDGQWYHQFLNTAQAHQISRGEGVTVAVIDTGADAAHPDLAGSVLPGTDLTGEQGDGRIDVDGHGTAMASMIAAHGRVNGIAPAAKILPVRVASRDGGGTSKFAVGIRWAVANGVKVISMSAGGPFDLLQQQEIHAAIASDVVVVAAAGNRPADTSVGFPASMPGVVAVAAVDKNGEHAEISVSGPEMVLAAPGVDISAGIPGGRYGVASGTSNATAITAGAVALIRARFPELKAPEVVRRLTATAIDKGSPGRDPDYGFGVLNLMGALTADIPAATSAPAKPSTGTATAPPSEPSRFPWWILLLAVVAVAGFAVAGALLWARRRSLSG
ncbi:MAG TPA: S8 family serine peptidase [Candidatus Limnocylindrales bacterium]